TGSTMFQYTRSVLHPSTRAASINSVGSAETRYWRMKKTPKALAAAGRMSAWRWSAQPNHWAIMMYSGMMPNWVGTIIVAITVPSRAPRPRKRSLAKAKPASDEVSTTEIVTIEATSTELVKAS